MPNFDGLCEHMALKIWSMRKLQEADFKDLPPYRDKWEAKYHDKIAKLNLLVRHSMRYPDIYQNTFLFDQHIDIMKEFRYEFVYKQYMCPS